ncbi:MAG: hypothetical protein IT371_18780 [Deltaproteobacteria bacterium]|nr:hypothetical protein [Deltaproteobacteria bacterium]
MSSRPPFVRGAGGVYGWATYLLGAVLCTGLLAGCGLAESGDDLRATPADPASGRAMAQAQDRCGGQADGAIQQLLAQVAAEYGKLTAEQKKQLCSDAFSLGGWEVNEWFAAEVYKSTQATSPEGLCGDGAAAGTLTISGQCHFAGEVNYILWGYINGLCGSWLWTTKAAVSAYRATHLDPAGTDPRTQDLDGRKAWTEVGWRMAKGLEWELPAPSKGYAYPTCSASLSNTIQWVLGQSGEGHVFLNTYFEAAPAGQPLKTDCATLRAVCTGTCFGAGCCKAKDPDCRGSFFTCGPPPRCAP